MKFKDIIILVLCVVLTWILSAGAATNFIGPVQVGPSCTSSLDIDQITSTDYVTLVNNGYICTVFLVSATAQNVSVVQAAGGTACATTPVALIGGTGTTPHIALAANGGFVLPIPSGNYIKTTTTGRHLCVIQDGAGRVAGVINYTDSP